MLKGKVALVTGSTSGIGLGIAKMMASHKADVMLNGFGDKDEIAKIQQELEKEHGIKMGYSDADLSKPEEVKRLINETTGALGAPDILVNNAGVQHVDNIEDFPEEKWQLLIDVNLSAPFYTMKYALPEMKKKGWGRVINIASAHGLVASPKKAAYVASKHGLVGMTKVVALENARAGVTVNAICPGWVRTPLVQKQIEKIAAEENIPEKDAEKKLLGEKQPSMHFVQPEEIGELAAFLCSDSARAITGSSYSIDGGWVAQ